ncbi:MAG: alpha/beta hydrolase [Acidobacteriota bacterium]
MRHLSLARRLTLLLATGLWLAGCGSDLAETEPSPSDDSTPSTALTNGDFTAEVDGHVIHYLVSGEGPPLMVLPNSWGITIEGLRPLFSGLEEDFTVVYFDPRGMGGSGPVIEDSDMGMAAVRTDFDSLRRHLGLDQVRVIGWSNGAQNLIFLAAEYPQTLSHVVFLHGIARFAPEDMADIMQRHPELTESFVAIQQQLSDESLSDEEKDAMWKEFVLETWFPQLFADPEAGRETLREIFADTDMSWRHNLYSNQEAGGGFDARGRLGSISAKSLVIAGAADMMPPERAEEIHDGIADSEFVVFEHSGHFAPVEEPERFVSTVVAFLE